MPHGIPLASFEDVFEGLENTNTAAGFSFPGLKKKDVLKETFLMCRHMIHRMKYGYDVYQPPMKLGFRGHLSPVDEVKVRPIWV